MLKKQKQRRHKLVETMADYDDVIAEKFLMEEPVTVEELMPVIRRETINLKITPLYVGSAKKNKGIQTLLDAVGYFLPSPSEIKNEGLDQNNNEEKIELLSDSTKPFVGLAFKLEDGRFGQLTYVRVYQGEIKKAI